MVDVVLAFFVGLVIALVVMRIRFKRIVRKLTTPELVVIWDIVETELRKREDWI